MKTTILITTILIFLMANSFSQNFVAVNLDACIPIATPQLSEGIGLRADIGHTFFEKLDLTVFGEHYSLNAFTPVYRLNAIGGSTKFHLLQKRNKIYLGCRLGYYWKEYAIPPFENPKERGVGVNPSIGALLRFFTFKKIRINTEISYNKITTKNPLNFLHLTLGIRYCFFKNNSASENF